MERYEFKTMMVDGVLMVTAPNGVVHKMPATNKQWEREALRRDFEIQEMEQKYDVLIERLEGLSPLTKEFDEALSELGAYEQRMAVLMRPKVSGFSSGGVREVSTTALRYTTLS
jgi:hypothetical protein